METLREQVARRHDALVQERSSWMAHWQEISENLMPRSGRFLSGKENQGDKRHNKIYDNTGIIAARTLSAGLQAGMTSPARPWFRLTTSDPRLDEADAVKRWLSEVSRLMQMIFGASNTYRALHTMYGELGGFGTAASVLLPNFKRVIHHYPLTIGQYCLALDAEGNVNTLSREFEPTVGQMVEEFGIARCSMTVRNLHDRNALDKRVKVIHVIEPRKARDASKRDNLNMPWRSVYFEAGGDDDKILRESGFKEFPVLAPRWTTEAGDVYGYSPGMEALGDIKSLQHEQLRKAQGIDYKTRPPLQLPTSMSGQSLNMLPGGATYVDAPGQQPAVRSLFEVNLDLSHLLEDIRDVRERIRSSFYADLFLMMANDTRSGITATEVAERHEEKLLMLGPVLERQHNELLQPKIELTFTRMVEAGLVPPAPPELQGRELNVEFVSMLAQAQRAVATNGIDRFVGNLGVIAQYKPDVLDKLDSDRWADTYADMLGVDPELIVPSQQVVMIRKQRAEAQQAAAAAEQMQQAADTASKLGGINTAQPNVLTDATRAFSGYS